MNPKYPVYIVSKGRWNSRYTSKAFEKMGIPYWIVLEKSEYRQYAEVIDPNKILILPQKYLDEYDTFDDLGFSKSKGPGAARNFCWDNSIANGFERHWVLDDNIMRFFRLNRNKSWEATSGTIFKCAEDFIDRYENVAIAGFEYRQFTGGEKRLKAPYRLNTRIYSCLLIKNDIPYRWRGRYNEDSDLCLRALKDGWCTLLFHAFIQDKVTTQKIKGGNTKDFYEKEGTYNKSKMIEDMHPDVAKTVWKFNRWHHHIDYRPFINNHLIKKESLIIPDKVNNYGMILKEVKENADI